MYLPFLESCLNHTYHESTGLTPHEIIFGRKDDIFIKKLINFPLATDDTTCPPNVLQIAKRNLYKAARRRKAHFDLRCKKLVYTVGQEILLRTHHVSDTFRKKTKKFFNIYAGPYVITAVNGNNTVDVFDEVNQMSKGTHNFKNIKPYFREPPDGSHL